MENTPAFLQLVRKNIGYFMLYAIINTTTPAVQIDNKASLYTFLTLSVVIVVNYLLYKIITTKIKATDPNENRRTIELLLHFVILMIITGMFLNIIYSPFAVIFKNTATTNATLYDILKYIPLIVVHYISALSFPILFYTETDCITAFIQSIIITIKKAKLLRVLFVLAVLHSSISIVYGIFPDNLCNFIGKKVLTNFINFMMFVYALYKIKELNLISFLMDESERERSS